jgi:hypothetical protein
MPPVGSRPGTLEFPEESPPPRIHVFDYDEDICRESGIDDVGQLEPYLASSHKTWVDVQGFATKRSFAS